MRDWFRLRPRPASPTDAQDGIGHEIDADFLEYTRREAASGGIPGGEQAELPWDA